MVIGKCEGTYLHYYSRYVRYVIIIRSVWLSIIVPYSYELVVQNINYYLL